MPLLYRIGYSLFLGLGKMFFFYRVVNQHLTHQDGGCLVAGNHVSFLDPPMIGIAFRDDCWFLARKTLFRKGIVEWVYRKWQAIPVDQNRPEMASLKQIIRLLKEGEKVILFPEGERSRDGQLRQGKTGVGLIVAKAQVPVLPVRIFGAEKALPRGKRFPRLFMPVTVVFGEPIDMVKFIKESDLTGKELYQAVSDRIMEAIGELKLPEEEVRGSCEVAG